MDQNGQFRQAVEQAARRIYGGKRRVVWSAAWWKDLPPRAFGYDKTFSCHIGFSEDPSAEPAEPVEPDVPTAVITRKDG